MSTRTWRTSTAISALAYRGAVQAFADAGCRYLQLDEVNLAYLCDPSSARFCENAATIRTACPRIYADMINTAISGPAHRT